MKTLLILLILISGILISGCVQNPTKEVPVIKVNITFVEKEGVVQATEYSLTQGTVSYLDRPKKDEGPFPAIAARTMISKGKNSTIGSWEMLSYTGPGTYSFNIGFDEKTYPESNDTVHVSIYVVNTKGERIGVQINNIIWK